VILAENVGQALLAVRCSLFVSLPLEVLVRYTCRVSNYRKLRVWSESRALAARCYAATATFPKQEQYGLQSQIRRAAVSISANVAEGSQRGSDREYARFVRIARGSAAELVTLVEISGDLGLIDEASVCDLVRAASGIGRMLSGLDKRLHDRSRSLQPNSE
jgi:four helix bundle protein